MRKPHFWHSSWPMAYGKKARTLGVDYLGWGLYARFDGLKWASLKLIDRMKQSGLRT